MAALAPPALALARPAQALARGPRWRRTLALVALGAMAATGQAPWGLWPATLGALALALAVLSRAPSARSAAGSAWALGAGYFALSLHWIVEPFLVDAQRYGWMAPGALILMALGAGLFWAFAAGLARRIAPGGWPLLLALVAALTLAEATRSLILTGFPWALLGHVWIDTPLAQSARIVGPHGLSLLTLGLAGLLAVPLATGRGPGWAAATAVLIGAGWIGLSPGPAPEPPDGAPVIRLVQPNAPQDEKWDPERSARFTARMLEFTALPPAADLTVWPESAVPWFLEASGDLLPTIAGSAQGKPVLLGIQRREGARYYNSLVVTGPTGEVAAVYDKWHLVPFGEYMPLGEVFARWGIHGLAASEGGGYTAGPGPAMIDIAGIGRALPLICYEGIFAEEVGAAPTRPRLMVLITNDAWFGNLAGPQQHLAQARLRAIEQGLPMVRVANTGISAMIDPRGRITARIGLNEAGWRDAALPAALPQTPYARLGDAPVLVLLSVLLFLAAFAARRFAIDAPGRGA